MSCVARFMKDLSAALRSNSSCSASASGNPTVVYDKDKVRGVVNSLLANCFHSDTSQSFRNLKFLLPSTLNGAVQQDPRFTQATGFGVNYDFLNAEAVALEVVYTLLNDQKHYDGWVIPSSSLLDVFFKGGLMMLGDYVKSDTAIDWPGLSKFVRLRSSLLEGKIVGIPISGRVAALYYRRDIFAARNLTVPATWDDVVALAAAQNGTNFGGDGGDHYSLCWQLSEGCAVGHTLLGQILASMTQYGGTSSGWLFNPETLQNLVNTTAMARALELVSHLKQYSWPDATCTPTSLPRWTDQQCLMTMHWGELFKLSQASPALKGSVGTAQLPGSEVVYDRKAKALRKCRKELCPYADAVAGPNGTFSYINRAPYFGLPGLMGIVNAVGDSSYSRPAYEFLSMQAWSNYTRQSVISLRPEDVLNMPLRDNQMDAASVSEWVAAGCDEQDVTQHLAALRAMMGSENAALDLRIIANKQYWAVMSRAVANSSAEPVADAVASMAVQFANIMATCGPLDVVLISYQCSIGYFPPAGALPLSSYQDANGGSGGGLSEAGLIAVIVMPTVCSVLALLFGVWVWNRRRMRNILGRTIAPGASARTTLLLTDLVGSTEAWEMLPTDVMDRSVGLHNSIIRRLLIRYGGYESAVEGDAFLAAFHKAQHALQFAFAAQRSLLHADWDAELLALPMCQPVWVQGGPTTPARRTMFSLCSLFRRDTAPGATNLFDSQQLQEFVSAGSPLLQPPPSSAALSAQGSGVHSSGRGGSSTPGGLHSSLDVTPRQSSITDEDAVAQEASLKSVDDAPYVGMSIFGQHSSHSLSRNSLGSTTDDGASYAPPLTKPLNVAGFFRHAWPAASAVRTASGKRLAFRGLRVRMALHTGVEQGSDVVLNKTAARVQYVGVPMAIARALVDAAQGGMVLMSEPTFLALDWSAMSDSAVALNLGHHLLKGENMQPMTLYQALSVDLVPRLGFLLPPRSLRQLQLGLPDAPLGSVTIAFMKVVGTQTLMQWNKDVMQQALELFQSVAEEELHARGGYLAEMAEGLCLAAFARPAHALMWSVSVVRKLKSVDWPEELLAHELCEPTCLLTEEMAPPQPPPPRKSLSTQLRRSLSRANSAAAAAAAQAAVVASASAGGNAASSSEAAAAAATAPAPIALTASSRSTPPIPDAPLAASSRSNALPASESSKRLHGDLSAPHTFPSESTQSLEAPAMSVLQRGLRIRVGIDVGQVKAENNLTTGRMAYRGRVMNRAARIAERAPHGHVLASAAVWNAHGTAMMRVLGVRGTCVGDFTLKGVTGPMELWQCQPTVAAAVPHRSATCVGLLTGGGGVCCDASSLLSTSSRLAGASSTVADEMLPRTLEGRSSM